MSTNPYAQYTGSGDCDGSVQHNAVPASKVPAFVTLLNGLALRLGSVNKACNVIKVPITRWNQIAAGDLPLTDLIARRILAAHKAHKHLKPKR
ncbi:hypothetical protein RG2014_035 [Delftia phage RG-2014]|uniref:Uncharacterized protein n=1 Tax=Delftia phage RG-2014 TaxID=1563661 RepID=A0A097PAL6_9CAUD|nr:hypothetical protein RG2014_035 [Delftia phage RG-2014]AIU44289.1 hypothetical protein RG2014_035 [Delftia phage RG-2014]